MEEVNEVEEANEGKVVKGAKETEEGYPLRNMRRNRRLFVGHGFTGCGKTQHFVIPSEARKLSFFSQA